MAKASNACYGLDAWREASYYTDRERAALEWTEALTKITDGHVPDALYDAVDGTALVEGVFPPGGPTNVAVVLQGTPP